MVPSRVELVARVEPLTLDMRSREMVDDGIRHENRPATRPLDAEEHVGVFAHRGARVIVPESAEQSEHRAAERHVRADAMVDVDHPARQRGEAFGERPIRKKSADRLIVRVLPRLQIAGASGDGGHRRVRERVEQRSCHVAETTTSSSRKLTMSPVTWRSRLVPRSRHPPRELRCVHVGRRGEHLLDHRGRSLWPRHPPRRSRYRASRSP